MAIFTIKELSPSLSHFDNTTVAGDTLVNETGGVCKYCLGQEVAYGTSRIVIEADLSTLVELSPGETSAALVDGDYYRYDTDLNITTVPMTLTVVS